MMEKNQDRKAVYDADSQMPLEVRHSFHATLKRGIYKELHRRKMLSDGQLCILLKTK